VKPQGNPSGKAGEAMKSRAIAAALACTISAVTSMALAQEPQAGNPSVIDLPENRSRAESRTIPITFTRYAASRPTRQPPVFYIEGTTLDDNAIQPGTLLFERLHTQSDLVVIQQRGVGRGAPPTCKIGRLPSNKPATSELVTAHLRRGLRECLGFWQSHGVDTAGYTVGEAAEDVEAVRVQIGAPRIDLIALGSGAQVGLEFLERHRSNVQRAVFASAEGVSQTVKLPLQTDGFFERLQTVIDADPQAKAEFPDVAALIRRVHRKLEKRSIKTTVPTDDGRTLTVAVGPFELQLVAAFLIGDPESVPPVLRAYNAADRGDFAPFGQFLSKLRGAELALDVVPIVRDIRTGVSDARMELFRSQAPSSIMGEVMSFPMPQLRGALGAQASTSSDEEVQSDVPALFLSGTLDGWTYPEDHRQIVSGFSSGSHVMVENAGHHLLNASPEVAEQIRAFLAGGNVKVATITAPKPVFDRPAAE
jgi:pimeloyl-ACP methyl ester carboxylesterase